MRRAILVLLAACNGPPGTSPPQCIEGLPPPPAVGLRPSLEGVTPAVAWTRPLTRSIVSGTIAMTEDRLAITAGARVMLFDHSGNLIADVVTPGLEGLTSPAADSEGNFYVAGAALYSIDRDGDFRFTTPFPVFQTPNVRGPLVSPDAMVYVATTEAHLYGFDGKTGALAWRREVGVNPAGEPAAPIAGAGNAIVTVLKDGPNQIWHAGTGEPLGSTGDGYVAMIGRRIGLVTQQMEDSPGSYPRLRIAALDLCGKTRWMLAPARAQWATLLGPDDALLVAERDDEEGSETFVSIYSEAGAKLAGPLPAAPPWAIGADGTVYGVRCDSPGHDGPSRLIAYSGIPELRELWRIELGASCPRSGPVIGEDGVLYFTWVRDGVSELVAVQTQSPGLAPTSWPTRRHDNRGSGWLR